MKDEILYDCFLSKMDINDVAEKFRKIGISIYADEDKRTYKNLYDVLEEVAEKIDIEEGD